MLSQALTQSDNCFATHLLPCYDMLFKVGPDLRCFRCVRGLWRKMFCWTLHHFIFCQDHSFKLMFKTKKPNENKVMLPVLTAGRQSRRLCRPTNKPENCGSSIFHRRTESMEPAADWTEKNTIDICLSLRTENVSFQLCILLWITWYNDYVMHPQSYSRGLRNRKTYANANAKKICSICPYRCN